MADFSLFRVIKWMKFIYLSPFVLSWVIWWGFGMVGESVSLVEAHRVNTSFNNSTNTTAPFSDPWLYKPINQQDSNAAFLNPVRASF